MTNRSSKVGSLEPKLNSLLARLSDEDLNVLLSEAKIVSLKLRTRVIRQDTRVENVYFPLTCMFSLLVTSGDKPKMEMATIGREGVVGAPEAAQSLKAMGLRLIQIPGVAVQISADAFRKFTASRPAMQQLVSQYMYALLRQILYGAACNRVHSMEERCARWLLMTQDRAGRDNFPLTQEFMSHMLGVRRATVNVATGMLKKAGFIRYVRGQITVIDRPGLESASCDCYKAITNVYASLDPGSENANR